MQKYQNTSVLSGYAFGNLVNMTIDVSINKTERFESIAVTYIDSIYNFALYMTKNECEAQDLVHYTYVKAYKHFNDLKDKNNYKTWLFKIAADAFMKSILRSNILANIPHTSDNEEIDEETSERDADDDIVMAIQSLPIKNRMIFILADIEKFSYREISYILDCPLETVSSELHKGRQMLKEKLEICSDRYSYQKSQSYEREVSRCE